MVPIRLFLCGDVMTGRGVDQILRRPSDPRLHELFVSDARDYVTLAEARSGPVPRAVPDEYVWGDALDELRRAAPHARVVNLETSVTTSDAAVGKGINYRMHPANVGCLRAAGIDVCVLANNHVLDWGEKGLLETLDVLGAAGLGVAGAGRDRDEARRPARVPLPGGRALLVFGVGCASSGIPASWAARPGRPGVELVAPTDAAADELAARVARARGPRDIALVSIHWGSNWGYDVPPEHVRFARRLVDGGVDLVHGHSSHHPRPLEVHRGRLILYGCGDFLSDYEGISGYEEFRSDLVLMYLVDLGERGELAGLRMVPFRLRRLRLERAGEEEARWLARALDAACAPMSTRVAAVGGAELALTGSHDGPAPPRRGDRPGRRAPDRGRAE